MDSLTNKAILIAVGIFVTISITSGITYTISKMKDIYARVYKTDISIRNKFSEFDQYDGTEKTGIDLKNAVKKYNTVDNVNVTVDSVQNFNEDDFSGSKHYSVSVEQTNGNVNINFKSQ